MNVGIRTYTPYVTLMAMPILEYIRYEQTLVRQLERQQENAEGSRG